MNILVCVKQVPDTNEIKIDPVKNTLIRQGVPSIVNPFDGYALEAAARIKDKDPDTRIVVMSMGPEQAKAALKECVAIAADQAYLISGRKFGGSDTLATSYIISEAAKMIEEKEGIKFDAFFFGKQAIDGDTAQTGPEFAEHLGLPQITYGLEAFVEGDTIKVNKEVDGGNEVLSAPLPCVVTFTKPAFDPRFPTIKRKLAANKAKIPVISDEELVLDETKIGLNGSPTRVKKTHVPQKKTGGMKIQEETAEDSAKKLYDALSDAGVL
jgi:electron transfer flavoprotein beta subunit